MKKLLSIIMLGAAMLTSCDMDLKPEGVLEDTNAIQSLDDIYSFRNGFYTGFRAVTTSSYFTIADIQTDLFNGLRINGNQMGAIANGNIVANDNSVASYWASLYGAIGNINYFLEKSEPVYKNILESGNDNNIALVERYIGEAHFMRAYYYCLLFDRWCVQYTPENADTPGMGLALVTKFEPTSDRSKYPGRSTMNQTLLFINEDLDQAMEAISQYEATGPAVNNTDTPALLKLPMSAFVSTNAIKALRARIALWISDYKSAYTYATDVINSGIYSLVEGKKSEIADKFALQWTDDTSDEIILLPYMSNDELSNAIGAAFIDSEVDKALYIPAANLIDEYEVLLNSFGPADIRLQSFVEDRDLNIEGDYIPTPCFVKFPGNPLLRTGSANNLQNMPKPFRLAEQYLIAAESAALDNNETEANRLLKEFRTHRYTRGSLLTTDYEGSQLINEIRLERRKELAGEGFRLSDLRRYKQGFNRADGINYENTDVKGILTPAGLSVTYSADDHRYTWPIPTDELQCNPQMAGQQNPGY